MLLNCWRALARQHPILYNSEKKAKSVGCKIEDMRSRMYFYIRAFRGAGECTWKYRSISSNSPGRSARNQGHDKRGEIWMSLITCGSKWFSDYILSRKSHKRFLYVWLFYYVSNFADSRTEVPRYWSSQSYFMRSFFLSQCIQLQWSVRQNYFHSE